MLTPPRSPSSKNLPATIASIELVQHAKSGFCLAIELKTAGNDRRLQVPLVWFRDHCRSPTVYNLANEQRKSDMTNIIEEARIKDRSAVTYDEKKLSIDWADGHKSHFDFDYLMEMLIKHEQVPVHDLYPIWNDKSVGTLPTLDKSSFDLTEFLRLFVDYGVVSVNGIEPTVEATEKFAREIAPLHDTFYGAIWVLNSKGEEKDNFHADSAYANGDLGAHTDCAFLLQVPGVQVFHCLRPADEGGETPLVDGFAAAERLKQENPSAYRTLTTTLIDHQYVVKGDQQLLAWAPARPVIELNEFGGYAQIRFNPYQRAPLRLSFERDTELSSPEQVTAFYEAYQAFARICADPSMIIKMHLYPGTMIFIDNFRVLHARAAFSGFRRMCGCYLSRDSLLAKARPHVEASKRLQI